MSFVFVTARVAIFLAVASLIAILPGRSTTAQSVPDESAADQLEEWLKERQLTRLSLRLVELRMSRELDLARRNVMAAQLAERYRIGCLTHPDDEPNEELVAKAERLIQNYPGIKNSGLDLAIAHARYLEAERNFLGWWREGAEPAHRDSVWDGFRQVRDRLRPIIEHYNMLQEKLIAVFPGGDSETNRHQEQLDQLESRLLHAHYLLGWATYFSAILPERGSAGELNEAQSAFYRALRIEQEEPIDGIDRKWLDFSLPLSRQSLLGLAMVYAAQRKTGPSGFCLDEVEKLDDAIGGMEIWQFNGLAWSRQWSAAIELASKLESKQPGPAALFWQAVAEAGFACASFDKQAAVALQRLGILGLLRQFEAGRLKQLVEIRNIQLAPDRFEDLWIKGLLDFEPGQPDEQRLKDARTALQSALQLVDEKRNPTDVVKVRYLLAMVEFKLRNVHETIALLSQSSPLAPTVDVRFAENWAWLQVRARIALSQAEPLLIGEALASLHAFQSQFPESQFANQAEFEQLKLSCALLPADEAVRRLAAVREHSPYYLETQFELVRTQYRLWSERSAAPSAAEQREFDSLTAMDQRFRALPGNSPGQQLASLMLVIDAALKRESTPRQTIDELLTLAERIQSNSSDGGSEFQSPIMYFRFLAARKFDNQPAASQLAHWISSNAARRSHRLAALMWLAQAADESGNMEASQRIVIYERLASQLGTSREVLLGSRNARATAARLSELYVEANRLDEAAALNDLLIELMPRQEQFILNAARIDSLNEKFAEALPRWRILARGSKTGSPVWLEAKLGMVRCLLQTDPAAAAKIYRQTISLIDQIPDPWSQVIAELGHELDHLPLGESGDDQGK